MGLTLMHCFHDSGIVEFFRYGMFSKMVKLAISGNSF